MSERQVRAENVNKLLIGISSCGRRFFRSAAGNTSKFIFKAGHLYFVDKYSGHELPASYPHGDQWGRHFSEGGTLKALVIDLARYIKLGTQIHPGHFGPWPQITAGGDLWGYGDDMQKIRELAASLDITRSITR